MINLVKSEVLKVRSTQVWLWMVLPAVALTALATIGTTFGSIHDHRDLGTPIQYYDIFTQSHQAAIALLVIGVLGLTTEFRHQTITPTLLATPNRRVVLAAKLLSYALFALFYAVICLIVNFAIAISWLSLTNNSVDFGHGVIGGVVKAFAALILMAVCGLGLGATLRNQAAGMVIGILYFAVINGLLSFIPWVRKGFPYTPGGAFDAFISNGTQRAGVPSDVHMLNPLVGGVVFLAYALVLIALGGSISLNRDIT